MHLNSLFFLLSILAVTRGSVIYVEPTSTNCLGEEPPKSRSSLQTILSNVTSNTVLRLEPGCHFIDRYVPVLDKTNVTIEGLGGSPDNVTVSCRRSIGLAFVNTSKLTLRMLTISKCGLTGSNLNKTVTVIKEDYLSSFESVFKFDLDIEIELFVAISKDVLLESINVERAHGFGLVAVNVVNLFTIDSCRFAYNYNETCFSSSDYGLSGGALVIFQDLGDTLTIDDGTVLSVKSTLFLNNSNCALDSQRQAYSFRVSQIFNPFDPYSLGGGGGLTVYLASYDYNTSVEVIGCVFQNNTGIFGGGMLIGTFAGISNNSITIQDSVFLKNGFELGGISDSSFVTAGQGLYVLKDIRFPFKLIPASFGINKFRIVNCSFQENVATYTAGAVVQSHYLTTGVHQLQSDTVLFENCIFTGNRAYTTPALVLNEAKQSGYQSGIQITISDTTFKQNSVLTTHFMLSALSNTRLNVVDATAVRVTLLGMNNFTSNIGTPLNLQTSVLEVYGTLSFDENTGNSGGGLSLSASFIILHKNSHVLFNNNQAYLQAGAINFDIRGAFGGYDCFLFFGSLVRVCDDFNPCEDPKILNITMTFRNNTAPISNVAYGSTLNTCPWVQYLNNTYNKTTDPYRMLQAIGVFKFTPALDDDSLSTPTVYLTTKVKEEEKLMLGQQVPVSVFAYDGFNQAIPDFISSTVLDDLTNSVLDSQLGDTSYWFVHRNRGFYVPVSIRSTKPIVSDKEVEVEIYSSTSAAGEAFNLNITQCYEGFEFPNNTDHEANVHETCVCNEQLQRYSMVKCMEKNASIVVPDKYWLGYVDNRSWSFHKCVFDYCSNGVSVIQRGQFNTQCREEYNRAGILCGKCEKGFSVQIGTSNKCKKCSNFGLFWVLYFILKGLVVIATIGGLGVTVSYGYINSLLFFANIISPFQTALFVGLSEHTDLLFFPINILNNGFGFPALCFFDGMTALHRSFVVFLFPTGYLYVLVFFYTICGRYCRRSVRKWALNAPDVFATVILLTYTSLIGACFIGIHFIVLDTDAVSLRWGIDPNEKYFSPGHTILVLICLAVLVLFLIPTTLMLIFSSLVLRTAIGKKLIPIYDAFWAPFKEKRHFWVSFRLLLRLIPLIISIYVPAPPTNFLLLGVLVIIYIFLHIIFNPFINEIQNILEIYLSLCLLLLITGALLASITSVFNTTLVTVYFCLVMCLVYFAIIFVFTQHLYMNSKWFQKAVFHFKRKCLDLRLVKNKDSQKSFSKNNSAISLRSDHEPVNYKEQDKVHTEITHTLLENML